MHKILLLGALLALGACSTIEEIYSDIPKEIAALELALATAEHTAIIYVSLPVCGKTTATLCRTADLTKKIGAADVAAYTAVEAARQAETESALIAAQTAVHAYQQITAGLNTGN